MTAPRAEDRRFPVGAILKGHGLAGQVKVRTAMHDSSLLAAGMTLLAELPNGERRELLLTGVHGDGPQLRLAFEGISDRDAADALRGAELSIARRDLPDPGGAGYYLGDLIGYRVVAESGATIGPVKDAWDLPANDVLQVEREGGELLIPLLDEFVTAIDHAARTVTVRGLEGLTA